MYKIVYNGMFEYIVIKICPKYDTPTNTGVFGLPHAFPPLAGHASPRPHRYSPYIRVAACFLHC